MHKKNNPTFTNSDTDGLDLIASFRDFVGIRSSSIDPQPFSNLALPLVASLLLLSLVCHRLLENSLTLTLKQLFNFV